MNCSSTIVQFYQKNDQKGNTILFSKFNIHLMITLLKLATFHFIKLINYSAEIQVSNMLSYEFIAEKCSIKFTYIFRYICCENLLWVHHV